MNYFKATADSPFHVSIGGLVFNDEGKVLVHHYKDKDLRGVIVDDFYLLLRETVEPNESIEQTLHRGLMEEFGLTGELKAYLGSIKGKLPIGSLWAEKTTLYFLVKYIEHDESRREEGSFESQSILEWLEPSDLIPLLEQQGAIDSSLDESIIVRRFMEWKKR